MTVLPGTTVVWEWTGEGGSKYACAPHEAMGMRGTVVVGNSAAEARGLTAAARAGILRLVLLAALSPLVAAALLPRHRERRRG